MRYDEWVGGAEYLHMHGEAPRPDRRKLYERIGRSYLALAEQEAWLAGEINPLSQASAGEDANRPT